MSKARRIRELWASLVVDRELEVRVLSLAGEQVDYDISPFVIVDKCFEPVVVVFTGRDEELHLFRIMEEGGVILFRGLNPRVWKRRLNPSTFSDKYAGWTITFVDPLFQAHALLK